MTEFRSVGKVIINVGRLLMAGYANDQDLTRNRATLSFDNGARLCLELENGRSLLDLVSPNGSGHQYVRKPTVPGDSASSDVSIIKETTAATTTSTTFSVKNS